MRKFRLERIWSNLQSKKNHMPSFLREVRLSGIRGIDDLRIQFDYPVSVIAGGNASGKSTVLFAAACAYQTTGQNSRWGSPSRLFPDYTPEHGTHSDQPQDINFEYDYTTNEGSISMRLRRKEEWSRDFFGREGGMEPERTVYLRTLSSLSNPSTFYGTFLSRRKKPPTADPLTAAQISFAQKMLPFEYDDVVNLASTPYSHQFAKNRGLLFAKNRNGAAYSELHMASGERMILRLAHDIAQLKDALVLIDEVETGLHPWAQQILMLQLQQLALINDLQIIVTSHSPAVIDTVPDNARIFLERVGRGKVEVRPAYRDIIQDALYGGPNETLNILCEDSTAEGILNGVMDRLMIEHVIRRGAFRIGRDTGASAFPEHAAAFAKFDLLENFVFVLDGDQRGSGVAEKIRGNSSSRNVPVLYLPGEQSPEAWVWERLTENPGQWAKRLHTTGENLATTLDQIGKIYDSASDTASNKAKQKIDTLAEKLGREQSDICRIVARAESTNARSDMQVLLGELKTILTDWRAMSS